MEILDPCLPLAPAADRLSPLEETLHITQTELIQSRAQVASLKGSVDRLTAKCSRLKQEHETADNIRREEVARAEVDYLSTINGLTKQRDEAYRQMRVALDDRDAQVQRANASESARVKTLAECERLQAALKQQRPARSFDYEIKVDTTAAHLAVGKVREAIEKVIEQQGAAQVGLTAIQQAAQTLQVRAVVGNAEDPVTVAQALLKHAAAETDDCRRLDLIREAREWTKLAH